MKRYRLIIFFLFILTSCLTVAQDAFFSQYFASGIYFNPAMAATETSTTLSGITRTQWKGTNTPYQTSMLALTLPIKDKFEKHKRLGAVSFSIYNDKSGNNTIQTTGFNVAGSYGVHLSQKNLLFFGIMAGYYQKSLDKSNFQWGSQYDPTLGDLSGLPPNTNDILGGTNYFDLNAGLLAVHDLDKAVGTDQAEMFFGLSTYHLTKPNESLIEESTSELPIRVNANLGALLPLSKQVGLSPNILYVHQGVNKQLNLGVYSTYYFLKNVSDGIKPNNVELGVWYRLEDSFIFNVGIGNEIYHLGFSYDLTTSNLQYSSGGNSAYEISFKLQKPHKKKERHYTPRF
jgi:type IX secretion system PorP/SprF family membrane protein